MDFEKRIRRLEMQNKILASKLYQVCLSHDHLSVSLNRAGIPMTVTDQVMMETTKRIMSAKTPEEIETIYSESSGKIWKGIQPSTPKPESGVQKIWFFKDDLNAKDLISQIEDMIADIGEQMKNLSKQDQELYEDGMDETEGERDPGDENSPQF